jgi:hypothetical protein
MRLTKKSLCPKCPVVKDCPHADNRTQCFEYNKAVKEKKNEKHKHETDNMLMHTTVGDIKRFIEDAFVIGYKSGYEQAYYELYEKSKGREPEIKNNADEIKGCLSKGENND